MLRLVDNIIKKVLSAILLMNVFTGCIYDDTSACGDSKRYIRMDFSVRDLRPTKADPHTAALPDESRLHSLQIWVFNSGPETESIGYKELLSPDLDRYVDAYGNLSLIITIEEDLLSSSRKLDFYIAANAASAGLDLPSESNRAELEQASFRFFSPDDPQGSVPSGGLPISRIVTDVDADKYLSTNSNPSEILEIPLIRAVSKLHFFFAQPQGLTGASVRRVVLDGDAVPFEEFFFPDAVVYSDPVPEPAEARLRDSEGYHTSGLEYFPSDGDIYYLADPAELAYVEGEDMQGYLNRLASAPVGDFGLTYLKETDQALSGTIYYSTAATGSEIRSVSFSLDPQKFVRNHEWIIYAYFTKDRLFVHPIVADWTDGGIFEFDWGYSTSLINQTGEDTRILYQDGRSYLMTAYGNDHSGLPYAPKLQLDAWCRPTTRAKMSLQLDNPDFGFVVDEGGVLSDIRDHIEFTLSPTPVSIIFYVKPKRLFDLAGPNPENPVATLNLFLLSEYLSSVQLSFNAIGLPGDTENILFHYVTPDQY